VCTSYSREEPFTVLNIDIRNQQNLLESLEQYVKGDLLEGANAYHCEKCNKKVSMFCDMPVNSYRHTDTSITILAFLIVITARFSFCYS